MTPKTTPQTLNNDMTIEQLDALLYAPEQTHPNPEVAALRSVFTDLREASTLVAAQQQRLAVTTERRFYRPFAWTFAAVALLFCAGAPLAIHRHPAAVTGSATPVATVAPSPQPAPAVSDAVLYADVEADLDASVPEPMLPLTNDTNTSSTSQRNPQ